MKLKICRQTATKYRKIVSRRKREKEKEREQEGE